MQITEIMLDCCAVYDGEATTVITGLDHLEGEVVHVVADGIYAGTKTVSGGQITLDTAAKYIIAGLFYLTAIKTLTPDAGARDGTAIGRKMRVTNPVLSFYKTGKGVKYGPDDGRLVDVPELTEGTLHTKEVPVLMPGGYEGGQIIIQQTEPLPMYLKGISYDVSPGD